MKSTGNRRKRSTGLILGGVMTPVAATAATLGVNLVVNPGFENVNLAVTSFYNAPMILDWTGLAGFAYSHDGSMSMSGIVPDYAAGSPLPGGGHWYFTPNNGGNESLANALKQEIDVSAGASAAAIQSGSATYDLRAFFSTYAGDADRGFVQADFLGIGGFNLGSAQVSSPVSPPLSEWFLFSTTGPIPVGTQTVRISSWGEAAAGGADGFTDNISFVVVPEPSSLAMVVIGMVSALCVGRRFRRS